MFKHEHIFKCQNLLILTYTLQQNAKKIVTNLEEDNIISSKIAKFLGNSSSVALRFYVLPKLHKPTLSMRPYCLIYINLFSTSTYNIHNVFIC